MTPETMADLHRLAFDDERPWSVEEFRTFIKDPLIQVYHAEQGYALTRTVAGESELLSLAVHPDHRRQGTAHQLMKQWFNTLGTTAEVAYLEVAADNLPALTLYTRFGFAIQGTRVAYYTRTSGKSVDAILMSCTDFTPASYD
ncbi:MAG: GNAT family N-acetyltransferase [Sulfitobacter sp.]